MISFRVAVVLIGVTLCGCATTPPQPAEITGSISARPAHMATGRPVNDYRVYAESPFEKPQPSKLVAVRGGSIMVETPAELASNQRQLAAMQRSVVPAGFNFDATGTIPTK